MFDVVKIEGGYGVTDHNGNIVIGYRSRKHAEQYATGATHGLFNAAEIENDRRNAIAVYLAVRANRVYVPSAQMELFA